MDQPTAKAVDPQYSPQVLRYLNDAHDHYDQACDVMVKGEKTNDVRMWQNYLAEARARVGLSRLALELAGVPDTRAIRE